MDRIGLYGGTFNPPHMGHVLAAAQTVESLKLNRLFVMPDRIAPHKQLPEGSASAQQRYEMAQIAFRDVPRAEVSDLELKREGPSYTWQTVQQLHAQYPDSQLALIMGTDMFLSFHQWRRPEYILEHAVLAVLYRGDRDETEAIQAQKKRMEAMGAKVELIGNRITQVSSTDLRRMLVFRCAGSLLPPGVEDYIRQNGFYGTDWNLRGLTMPELEKTVVSLLKPDRVAHVLGCRDTAVEMAKRWGADPEAAGRAGILHDITKALDGGHQLTLCREYGILLDAFSEKNPKTLHALTGSLVAERIFGESEPVVSAIRHHTTGKANMSVLEKIIYVADYMEPNRNFPGVERLRELAFSDLDGALKLGLEMTLEMLCQQNREISPESQEALNWLNRCYP